MSDNNLNQKIGRTQRENAVVPFIEILDNSPTDVSIFLWVLFEDMLDCDEDFKFIIKNFHWFSHFLNELRWSLVNLNNSTEFKCFIESNRELVDQLVYCGGTLTHDYDIEVLLSLRESIKDLQYKIANFNVG